MTNIIKDKNDLAEVIVAMPFGELMHVARQLVAMNADDPEVNRHPETPLGMAETLYDWAQAQVE